MKSTTNEIKRVAILSILLLGTIPIFQAYAEQINPKIDSTVERFYEKYSQIKKVTPTDKLPRFLNLETPCNEGPCYVATQRPTPIIFNLKAVDYRDNAIKVECQHESGHTFPVGPTRNHCIAIDLFGNQLRGSFVVTIGYNVVKFPSWVKTTTVYWVNDKISDKEFYNAMEYLLKRDIVSIPTAKTISDNQSKPIPSWVTVSADKWSKGNFGDHEYSIALQWFIENGFIKTK